MADLDVCSICNSSADSWRHSLIECNMAKCVWALMDDDILDYIAASKQEDPKLWLFGMIEALPHADVVKVLVTLWAIWWAKRKAIHEKEFQSPMSTYKFIQSFLEDLDMAQLAGRRPVRPQQQPHMVKWKGEWIPPESGCVKINVDGGLSRAGDRGVVSAICRDELGNFLGASAVVLDGLIDPPSLEAVACSEAFSLAFDLNLAHVQVATD